MREEKIDAAHDYLLHCEKEDFKSLIENATTDDPKGGVMRGVATWLQNVELCGKGGALDSDFSTLANRILCANAGDAKFTQWGDDRVIKLVQGDWAAARTVAAKLLCAVKTLAQAVNEERAGRGAEQKLDDVRHLLDSLQSGDRVIDDKLVVVRASADRLPAAPRLERQGIVFELSENASERHPVARAAVERSTRVIPEGTVARLRSEFTKKTAVARASVDHASRREHRAVMELSENASERRPVARATVERSTQVIPEGIVAQMRNTLMKETARAGWPLAPGETEC